MGSDEIFLLFRHCPYNLPDTQCVSDRSLGRARHAASRRPIMVSGSHRTNHSARYIAKRNDNRF